MAKQQLPVTPELIDWEINASGYTADEVAQSIGVEASELESWKTGDGKPSVTQLRKLATKLHRPFATFFLPQPPVESKPRVEFRHPPEEEERTLNPEERRFLRRAQRLQGVLNWIASELGLPEVDLPRVGLQQPALEVASVCRTLLDISFEEQKAWPSSSIAFDKWREGCESLGILVFLFSLGKEAARGFSIWDARAPVIAINTAWNEEARIFTLFHECGHLLTRTNSACVEAIVTTSTAGDPVERWCERFAAGVLMPREAVLRLARQRRIEGRIRDLSDVRWFANQFKVSLRAATIQLIEVNLATWDDYKSLPGGVDTKKPGGGGGGGGRDLGEIRGDQLGHRTAEMFKRAVAADVMSQTQALDYLDVTESHFESLATGA
jgi:Zn-dependent peptidase ImmA (M78 family)